MTEPASPGPRRHAPVRLVQWDSNPNPLRTAAYRHAAARFQATHPGVTIDYVGIPFDRYRTELEAAFSDETAPDIFDVWPNWIPGLVARGRLHPLHAAIARWPARASLVAEHARLSRFYRDEWWFLVVDLFLQGTHYRRDLGAQIDGPSPAELDATDHWTWAAWERWLESVARLDPTLIPCTFRGGSGAELTLFNLMVSAGGGSFFDASGACRLDQPGAIKALDAYAGLTRRFATQPGALEHGYQAFTAPFYAGNAAAMLHGDDGINALPRLGRERYANCRLPHFGPPSCNGLFGFGLAVAAGGGEAELAADYVCHFTETYVANYLGSWPNVAPGAAPVITGAPLDSDLLRPEFHEPLYDPFFGTVARDPARLYLPPFSTHGYDDIVQRIVLPEFREVCLGCLPAHTAATRWARAFEDYGSS